MKTLKDAAKDLDIKIDALRYLIRAGYVQAEKRDGRVRVDPAEVKEVIENKAKVESTSIRKEVKALQAKLDEALDYLDAIWHKEKGHGNRIGRDEHEDS